MGGYRGSLALFNWVTYPPIDVQESHLEHVFDTLSDSMHFSASRHQPTAMLILETD